MSKAIGTILLAVCIIGTMYLSGGMHLFLDIPSILVILIPIIAVMIARHGVKSFGQLFSKDNSEILQTISYTALLSGVLGTIIGLVSMLANLSNPNSIGPAMAVALLSSLYGLIVFLAIFAINNKGKINILAMLTPLFMLGACSFAIFSLYIKMNNLV